MNTVGIDVSKGKSMVATLRPFGEIVTKPFEVHHPSGDIHQLLDYLNAFEGASVSLLTGRYYELQPAGLLMLVSCQYH